MRSYVALGLFLLGLVLLSVLGFPPGLIAEWIGATIAVWLVSRLFVWALKRWLDPVPRFAVADALAGCVYAVLSAFGHSDGGSLNVVAPLILAILATAYVLAWDGLRLAETATAEPNVVPNVVPDEELLSKQYRRYTEIKGGGGVLG
jgi:hypothetical protein